MIGTATQIVRRLQEAGHIAYFAGGGVRDRLLGREPKDIDIATSATPDQVQKLFPKHSGLVGKVFGVVNVVEDDCTFEVAQFRRDGVYRDGRRPESVEPADPEQDAQRRDFTINGLFYDPIADRVIDYVGGCADLHARTLRAIGSAEARFREDKLRLLRAVRFASTLRDGRATFEIEDDTWAAIRELAPRLQVGSATGDTPADQREWFLSPERVRDELDKMWTAPAPARSLDLLDASGLLERVLPDVAALHGIEQPPQFHPEGDVYEHVRLMMSMLENPPLVLALAVLFHDVAKKPTQTVDETGRIRFNGHETLGAEMAEQIMRDLRYSNDTIAAVCELVRYHMQFKDVQRMKISTIKRMLARDHFDLELELHRVDCLSSHGDIENYDLLIDKREEFSVEDIEPPRLVNGKDLLAMGIPPGRRVGDILEAIREAQLNGDIETREQALAQARKLAAE